MRQVDGVLGSFSSREQALEVLTPFLPKPKKSRLVRFKWW